MCGKRAHLKTQRSKQTLWAATPADRKTPGRSRCRMRTIFKNRRHRGVGGSYYESIVLQGSEVYDDAAVSQCGDLGHIGDAGVVNIHQN